MEQHILTDELEGVDIKAEMALIAQKKSKLSYRLRVRVAFMYRRMMGDYQIIECQDCNKTIEWYGPAKKSCPLCGEGRVKITKGAAV